MIPRADIANTVQPVAAVEAPASIVSVADAKQEAFSRLAQIAIGQQLQGKVLSTYNDGSHLVSIANTVARMVLPAATKTGDSLLLTMISKEPRPTFLLTENGIKKESADTPLSLSVRMMEQDLQSLKSASQGLQTGIGRNLQTLLVYIFTASQGLQTVIGRNAQLTETQADAKTPQQGPGAAPASSQTSLSAAGKLIDALLHTSEKGHLPGTIKPDTPLVDKPTNTVQLARALHDTIALSGTFYEAHVAAWSAGKRPLSELQKEPQAQLTQQAQANSTQDLLKSSTPSHTPLGQIIHLQINALEQQRIVWHGEAWPGQQMEWEIGQDSSETPQEGEQENKAPPGWHSVVRFNFAHLGNVSASIRLTDQQIHIRLHTDNDITAAALRANSSMLLDAMAAAGSPLDSLIVKQDGQT